MSTQHRPGLAAVQSLLSPGAFTPVVPVLPASIGACEFLFLLLPV